MIVCVCNAVTQDELHAMIRDGVDVMDEVCTGCGKCEDDVIKLIKQIKKPVVKRAFSTSESD